METIQLAPRPLTDREQMARLYVGRHRGAYTKHAEMKDKIARNATPYVGRHAAEVTA